MKIGILGAGQLGRMLGEAAEELGYTTRFLDPATEVSVRSKEDRHTAAFEDIDELGKFRPDLDAVTFEFENLPVESLRWLAERLPVHPSPDILRVAQDRLLEKDFFAACGIPTPRYADIHSRESLDEAVVEIGLPSVLKTRRFGYDGKGQRVLRTAADVEEAWEALNGFPLILEGFVPFECEISAIATRSPNGKTAVYDPFRNIHGDGILRLSLSPAVGLSEGIEEKARLYVERLATELGYVGVLAVEFFVVGDELIANEMAPRVHNSGHGTIEGNATSQFTNHLRCVAGEAPTSPKANGYTAMINLIGEIPEAARSVEGGFLHDYDKKPRPGRKVGHLTLIDADRIRLARRVEAAWKAMRLSHWDLVETALNQLGS